MNKVYRRQFKYLESLVSFRTIEKEEEKRFERTLTQTEVKVVGAGRYNL